MQLFPPGQMDRSSSASQGRFNTERKPRSQSADGRPVYGRSHSSPANNEERVDEWLARLKKRLDEKRTSENTG